MKYSIWRSVIPLLIAFLALSCQTDQYLKSDQVEQRLIFQFYEASYDAENEFLSVVASFRENNPTGTTLELTKESRILLNGQTMKGTYSDEEGYLYRMEIKGPLPDNLTFLYHNNDSKEFQNRISISSFELKDITTLTIHKKRGAVIPFAGKRFTDDETLYCHFYRNGDVIETIELPVYSGSTVSISPDALSIITPGKYECRFSRIGYSSDVTSMDRGGQYETEYISKKIKINIVEQY